MLFSYLLLSSNRSVLHINWHYSGLIHNRKDCPEVFGDDFMWDNRGSRSQVWSVANKIVVEIPM